MAIDVTRPERSAAPEPDDRRDLDGIAVPTAPPPGRVWRRAVIVAAAAIGLYLLDKIALLFMDLWLFESLGYESVFWTNFRTGLVLFLIGAALFGAAVAVPAYAYGMARPVRRRAVQLGVLVGIVAGYLMTWHVGTYLLARSGRPFGETDPVFGHDLGFYVFRMPAIVTTLHALGVLLAVLLLSSIAWALARGRNQTLPTGMRRLTGLVGLASTPLSLCMLVALGVTAALRIFVARYDILVKDNYDASVYVGPEYIDVTGFFSTVNGYTVSALAVAFGMGALALRLRALHRSIRSPEHAWLKIGAVSLLLAMTPGLLIDFSFRAVTALRHETQVSPNEPVVQLPFIKRHIDATRKAYGLDNVEAVDFVPNDRDDPKPDVEELLASPTLRNAPLWPGYAAWLEQQLDPEYVDRLLATGGDTLIYGPTLDIFNAQQKLRPYYEVMDVDTVRYRIDGEDVIAATAVRETPLVEPQPWLAWWGQQYFLFTHGHGLVTAPVSKMTPSGEPDYLVKDVPSRSSVKELEVDQNAVYYGEGSGTMGYSNVRDVPEHDFPTEQGRAEVFFPRDVEAGVRVDSFLKRLVFGYKSRQFLDVLFSDLIDPGTRVHYFRTPLERVERIAPFLFADTDPYPVSADRGITWMVNGMTTTDRYPYSMHGDLGDKSHVRTPTRRPIRNVNYVKDAVKATIDAYTGKVDFYKWTDEPVVDTWADIYPDLFKDRSSMPGALREHVYYPTQLFHLQFDDLYIFYQMDDPLTFFSLEDRLDDGDEVVGPILSEGAAISFSIEPYFWIAEADGAMPKAKDDEQFALSMAFTPEDAVNLRSIITVYQDGEDYGRTSMLRVPKGTFVLGPEQADAAVDQDAFISQQIALWNRQGLDVIRGHTTPLVVDNELLYIEPIFIKSKQNPVPQLKRVVVVFRGHAALGETLEEALRAAVNPPERFPVRPGPELGGEPGFARTGDQGFQEAPREGDFRTTVPRDPTQEPRE